MQSSFAIRLLTALSIFGVSALGYWAFVRFVLGKAENLSLEILDRT